jgi:predicted RNA binding protein YcfA (HicA-like mRNA interferase family)
LRGPAGQPVTIPVHGAKTLPVGTIGDIIEQSGLTIDESVKILNA